MTGFERSPSAHPPAREIEVTSNGVTLSGLLAEPADGTEPLALVVALHGAGMHAGYYHAGAAPGLSLLELGSELGYNVWAPDRPGHGASADLPNESVGLFDQARILHDAIEAFVADHPVGAGVFLMGHSYGLKVAFTMAAERRGHSLLGLDGAGSGIRYAFTFPQPGVERIAPETQPGDRGASWGPSTSYPKGTFSRKVLPLHSVPAIQAEEGARWPDDLRAMADRIDIPIRLTFGEHDRLWMTDEAHFAELRSLLGHVPRLVIDSEPDAGHNISLGWAARPYHLKALAFADDCILSRRLA